MIPLSIGNMGSHRQERGVLEATLHGYGILMETRLSQAALLRWCSNRTDKQGGFKNPYLLQKLRLEIPEGHPPGSALEEEESKTKCI